MSRVYFPLKSSVELFDDRETPEAVTRVKQAAILYDEVVIEDGLYTAAISTQGGNSWWEPWSWVDEEKLRHTRRKGKPGSPVSFGLQLRPGSGEPGEGPVQMFSQGGLIIDYAAEFHTGILDDLAELEPDWLQVIAPGGTTAGWPEELRDTVRQLDQGVFFDRVLMKDRNTFEKGFITKNFNQDAAMASYLDATFNVTSLYEPMLQRGNLVGDHAGHAALELLVPNVGSLTGRRSSSSETTRDGRKPASDSVKSRRRRPRPIRLMHASSGGASKRKSQPSSSAPCKTCGLAGLSRRQEKSPRRLLDSSPRSVRSPPG